jgi:hypothetical protein
MIPGKIKLIFLLLLLNYFTATLADEKSRAFPPVIIENSDSNSKKKNIDTKTKEVRVNIIALDKITAKTSDITILLGETKKFGLLEIKALQCGSTKSITEPGHAAYIQVKDLSENRNDQIFVFNGWTFSSTTTLRPLDHPVYDFWLVSCENV